MTRRNAMVALALLTACTVPEPAADAGVPGTLKRMAAVPLGAEVTGLFLHEGDLFFNAQHPDTDLAPPFGKPTVGVVVDADFEAPALPLPEGSAQAQVTSAVGPYNILAQPGDHGTVGVIRYPDGGSKTLSVPDFNGLVPTGPTTADLFTNWEARPGGMSRIGLVRGADGRWQVDPNRVSMLDFSPVEGTWTNCFGTVSPWGTPLSAEELYFDNTGNWLNPAFRIGFGINRVEEQLGHPPNPYRYGYIVEITDPSGAANPVKRFALGRFSHENAAVMPDRRTVYLSDDGTDTVLFKFVADRAGDLSAGTLYGAKATQRTPAGSGAGETGFDIDWVRLAHASEDEIAAWIAEYDDGGPYLSDGDIADWAAGRAPDDRVAFLESRKAAAARGATAEFRKMEGVNLNPAAITAGQHFVYVAMSEISKGMSDARGDVRVQENICGIVYRMTFDASYSITAMEPAVVGGPDRGMLRADRCDPENIANPDNVVVRDNGDVIIGEDTRHHRNAAIWLWRPEAR